MSPVDLIRLKDRFAAFDELWRPKTVARRNGQELKLAKVKGAFPWHAHSDADEHFLVFEGRLRMEMRPGPRVLEAGAGEMILVPRGAARTGPSPRQRPRS